MGAYKADNILVLLTRLVILILHILYGGIVCGGGRQC